MDGNYVVATNKGIKKVNSECDTIWSKIFTDPSINFITQTSDGGYAAIKYGYSFLKTDS